ncbi:DNA-binding transcriptional regulator, GntR family [Curtobacterium sp. 314Chir4.1]|uniref:GntR family transcriptional regulator n=1 Tax=Curtobacterium sp. 314Chir4.1 TaxID=1279028 RepID=UPI000BD4CA70|nr:GntR family transcriptional regulator [Curtobacterium sp. 314Chir4.1]SOC89563.1 DNA-binding transcriptional regulator, GntR family [Curtobacterium sp. 314Chir4.1]
MPIPKPTRPAKRLLLRDVVFAKLRDAIVSGQLQPGETIGESDVESWANASRTPVREAIDRLAAVGLVDVLPQRGTLVAALDPRRASSSFSLLGELLAVSSRIVVPATTVSQRDAVVRRTRSVRSATELIAEDGVFDALVGVIGNPRLRQAWDELVPHVLRTWTLAPEHMPSMDELDLDGFAAAVADGDGDHAEAVLRRWFDAHDAHPRTVLGARAQETI